MVNNGLLFKHTPHQRGQDSGNASLILEECSGYGVSSKECGGGNSRSILFCLQVGIARSYPEKLPDCCYNALVLVGASPTNKS